MLIPMPAIPQTGGPPSSFALSRRPWIWFILALQILVCFGRIFFLLDIMGGFVMGIMIAVGVFGMRQDMNITFLCYWGMMCLINGSFDLVKIIDYAVKTDAPFFIAGKTAYNIQHGLAVAIPIVTLIGAPLAYGLYSDAFGESSGDDAYGGRSDYRGNYGGDRGSHQERASMLGSRTSTATFAAFEGQGQRLGGN
eukprot:TRINITY_DN1408_c0_g1_i1.p1 TRINITY_DN1408_c0_g1~~TRINITY_DN1408_c0_g1_i1.p1  ORF type:complete len:195 (-),score=24.20 TRINITY_DN1408_c0_g1_i1:81-665(-)